ncbi:putative bifunctional diguanylate cyclase/phosphodiesterase [Nocardioides nematodiphilus]|uniref:putative bifunctional diguanylate cyclase/phosphodiesterase n=1 Tax=Nocardioides nematodiphilus TaxID=2849669 RepID=UPI001CDA535C|nr:bifunctional diguanylate cyclase/phosphodiesterase [Nocardioides nematodiphilus]MCA1983564.1 bifunctional diguanylate cyclase/phosphodiesterase [Nocardioides nematodiphilus]
MSTLRFDLDHAWREAPAMATPSTLRISATFLLGLAGSIAALCAMVMPDAAEPRLTLAGVGLLVLAGGAVCAAVGHRLPRWSYELLVTNAILLVTLVAWVERDRLDVLAVSSFYLLPVVAGAMQFSLRKAMPMLLLALLCRGWVTIADGVHLPEVLMVEGCLAGLAVLVAWMAHAADVAEVDPLTGALNRRGLERRLEGTLRRLDREGGQCALIAMDIDNFKQVNDVNGHQYGDRLLMGCANAWHAVLPERSVLGRHGGDEFIVLLPDTSLGQAADVADRLRAAVPGEATSSAGVAAWGRGDSQSLLLSRADVALYEAKSSGRDRTSVYGDPDRDASELEAAIAAGEMRVMLQPVVELQRGDFVAGYEALVRWHRPGRGIVSPDDFIPQAERTGAIHALGRWVLDECCRLAALLPEAYQVIGTNVSVHELRRAGYAEHVSLCLETWGTTASRLVFEVTESVFEDNDPQIIQNLCDLREMGSLVAIDDFGAGYSSLRRIEQLPIDLIKVDGTLTRSIREGHDPAILRAIVTMARSLGVRLLAEHVETEYQAQVLRALGYELAQGYFFGRAAVPGEAYVVAPRVPVDDAAH